MRGYGVRAALRSVEGSVVAGRSLTCPSPSSMTRQVPSARSARSTVTKGRASELISGVKGVRSISGGRLSGVSGWAVTSRQVPPAHQVRASAGRELLVSAQHEAAGELVLAQLAEPGRDLPRGGMVGGVGNVGGLVPVVLHRLDVVTQHRGARTEARACGPELLLGVTFRPGCGRGERRQRVVPARQLVCPAELLGAGAHCHALGGCGAGERGILAAGEHPATVDRYEAAFRDPGQCSPGSIWFR
jgi:hypothetical protein